MERPSRRRLRCALECGFHEITDTGPLMNISILLPLLGILLGGVFLSTQAPINAALARSLGDPVLAACISFGIGFIVLAAISVVRGAWPPSSAIAAARIAAVAPTARIE